MKMAMEGDDGLAMGQGAIANGENGHEGGLAVGGGMAIEGGNTEGGGCFADDGATHPG
jgi:hypothetical protein